MTESEVIALIKRIIVRLCNKFRFGYHDIDDMKQQAFIFAIEGLEKYDGVRPLENFLRVHIRNRLFNFKRDNYERPDCPCFKCDFFDRAKRNQCGFFDDTADCSPFYCWSSRNFSKRNLVKPIELDHVSDENESNMRINDEVSNNAVTNETLDMIDKELPVAMRSDYVKMRYNIRIPKSRRIEIEQQVLLILRGVQNGKKEGCT